jgi:hypothetical protein
MAGDISYLKRMRTGQPPHNMVTLGNGSDSFEVAVVLLPNDTMLSINEDVESRYHGTVDGDNVIKNPIDTPKNRAMYYNRLLCFHCMRIPDDLNKKVADSADEIGRLLDDEDIKRVCEQYNNLLINKAPKLELLTEEELDSLKKYLEVTPLKDISTVSLVHLKYCHQTLVSEKCLTSNGSGFSSIKE